MNQQFEMNTILTFMKTCPFCGSHPKSASGYNIGKVYCSNDNCNLSNLYFFPHEWDKRS